MTAGNAVLDGGADVHVVGGRSFVRTSPDGALDGAGERGIYAEDQRLVRVAQLTADGPERIVAGHSTVLGTEAGVRFVAEAVPPGGELELLAEVDGTDTFTVRRALLDASEGHANTMHLGAASGGVRMRVDGWCELGEPHQVDGFAASPAEVRADCTARRGTWRWRVPDEAGGPRDVVVELRLSWTLDPAQAPAPPRPFDAVDGARRDRDATWLSDRPHVDVGDADLAHAFERSMHDLASLRITGDHEEVPGAGVPWFLTVFGRDSLLTSWMALPVDPEMAPATLRYLAARQAVERDDSVDAEPGKVMHEERRGPTAARWHARYFGSVDSTPLFILLLAESCRWRGELDLARELESAARAAVDWLFERLAEDELGLLAFERRAERGLDIQSWKDSHDSQRDRDGRVATGRIRPLEVQAYAVAALRSTAWLARDAWGDPQLADRCEARASELATVLVDRFHVTLPEDELAGDDDPRRDGWLAQGLDAAGTPLDALCSNIGHVLWMDAIADDGLRARSSRQLVHPVLDSGWGIRTMSTLDAGYDPVSYHCGSVWPHDSAICIAGIAGAGDVDAAAEVARGLLDAAISEDGRLPELFSGAPRSESPDAPHRYAATCSPQAWAAAAPFLVLRALLGLEPDAETGRLVTRVERAPALVRGLRWHGVHALGTRWDVSVDDAGAVGVEPVA